MILDKIFSSDKVKIAFQKVNSLIDSVLSIGTTVEQHSTDIQQAQQGLIDNKNYVDAQIQMVTATGIPRLNSYPYDYWATTEGQTIYEIPNDHFNIDTDTLMVFYDGIWRARKDFSATSAVVNGDGSITKGYVTLAVGRPLGSYVGVMVLKNVPIGAEGSINGGVMAQNSIPLNRIVNSEEISLRSDDVYEIAGGTANDLTLSNISLSDRAPKTFIASDNSATGMVTINTKPLYKPATTSSPKLTKDKAYTIWYNLAGDNFFIKASAEGNAIASHVLAGDIFSTDADTGIVGTLDLSNLISANIKSGITINGVTGAPNVVDTTIGTNPVTASTVRSGYKGYANGALITGTMTEKAAAQYNPSTVSQQITGGQFLVGTQTLNPVTGTAAPAQVLNSYTFCSASGINITGTMPNNSGTTLGLADSTAYTASAALCVGSAGNSYVGAFDLKIPNGFFNGSSASRLHIPNLLPANIVSGVNVGWSSGYITGSATIQSLGGYQSTWGSVSVPGSGSYTVNTGGMQPKFILCRAGTFMYVYSASYATASGYRLDTNTWYSDTTNASYKISLTSTGFTWSNFSAGAVTLVYIAFY